MDETIAKSNWFDSGGRAYARFRPEYPKQLAAFLRRLAPDGNLAVDVGCGSGQLTRLLAPHFTRVIGVDSSADQLANTLAHGALEYRCAPAERLPVADASASLITAAQAAHWFDLPTFYREARRTAAPGAVLALISYGTLRLEPALDPLFQHFYANDLGPFWPPERKLVDAGYADIDFPFDELAGPSLHIRQDWHLFEFLGYLMTWSAMRGAKRAGREDLLTSFAERIGNAWGDPDLKRPVVWPINTRIGKL